MQVAPLSVTAYNKSGEERKCSVPAREGPVTICTVEREGTQGIEHMGTAKKAAPVVVGPAGLFDSMLLSWQPCC